MPAATDQRLADLLTAAAAGEFAPVDGTWHRVPPWHDEVEAVVAFTGHAVLAVTEDVTDDQLDRLGADGFGGAHDPRLITEIAGPGAWIDSLDVLLSARGTGSATPTLVPRPDLDEHPRTRWAARVRHDVTPFGYPDPQRSAVAVLSRGVAGLRELSFEVEPEHRGGAGAALVQEALEVVPAGELVLAAAAPGNASSLRALLSSGFTPLGSSQLFRRDRRA